MTVSPELRGWGSIAIAAGVGRCRHFQWGRLPSSLPLLPVRSQLHYWVKVGLGLDGV